MALAIEGRMVTEVRADNSLPYPEEYVQRVRAFFAQISGWCKDRGLAVENDVVTLREEMIADYEAPSLRISNDGVPLAEIVSVGSRILGAQGRVDLIGQMTRHRLLFHVGKGAVPSTRSTVMGKAITSKSASRLAGVAEDGWYWIEATIRRPKRVDECLFLDLLTDVSDYEF